MSGFRVISEITGIPVISNVMTRKKTNIRLPSLMKRNNRAVFLDDEDYLHGNPEQSANQKRPSALLYKKSEYPKDFCHFITFILLYCINHIL